MVGGGSGGDAPGLHHGAGETGRSSSSRSPRIPPQARCCAGCTNNCRFRSRASPCIPTSCWWHGPTAVRASNAVAHWRLVEPPPTPCICCPRRPPRSGGVTPFPCGSWWRPGGPASGAVGGGHDGAPPVRPPSSRTVHGTCRWTANSIWTCNPPSSRAAPAMRRGPAPIGNDGPGQGARKRPDRQIGGSPTGIGRERCTPMWTVCRCCGTASSWVRRRWPMTNSAVPPRMRQRIAVPANQFREPGHGPRTGRGWLPGDVAGARL